MAAKVYLETSVISYLGARPSRDLILAAHQQLTSEWWHSHKKGFDVYVSDIVVREAEAGDRDAALRRLELLEGIPTLSLTEEALALADKLVRSGVIPERARADALHIAVSAANGMDYLLTWNCRHIANAETRRAIERGCREAGYLPPILCTPEELMGE